MAYGAIRGGPVSSEPLAARVYPISLRGRSDARAAVLTLPFDFSAGDEVDAVLESKLHREFNIEIETGRTYPQEQELTPAEFRAYFLAYRLVVGIFVTSSQLAGLKLATTESEFGIPANGTALSSSQLATISIGQSKLQILLGQTSTLSGDDCDFDWDTKCAFSYYIKPNYPGRSSHLCNAGFVVPTPARGMGLGQTAGRSFLFYGLKAGYRGSIFNLVYTSNAASAVIWERLGFQIVGTIPEAGRLKSLDGTSEEYTDAYVVYGDFRKIGVTE